MIEEVVENENQVWKINQATVWADLEHGGELLTKQRGEVSLDHRLSRLEQVRSYRPTPKSRGRLARLLHPVKSR